MSSFNLYNAWHFRLATGSSAVYAPSIAAYHDHPHTQSYVLHLIALHAHTHASYACSMVNRMYIF